MGMIHFNYRSQVLGYYVNISIAMPTDGISYFAPDTTKEAEPPFRQPKDVMFPGMKFQTMYMIHGGGDDDTLPFRYMNVERYAQEHRLMVVCPGIPNSFGANSTYGVRYMDFLTEELPVVIQSYFPSSPKREDNFVMGFAMGGNVALAMAIKRPDLYAHCLDMSGGIGFTLSTKNMIDELKGDHFKNHFYRYNATFGDPETFAGSENDLYPIAKANMESGKELTPITILCGSKEFIRARVEEDVRILKELNYPMEYYCAEGYDHTSDNWDYHLQVAFKEWLPLKNAIL